MPIRFVALVLPTALASPAQSDPPQVAAPIQFERADASGRPRVRVKETIIGFNDPNMNEESFVSSPDGRRVAYMIMSGDGIAVVVDGEKGEEFEGFAAGSLAFSPDGKHLAYVGTRPGKQYAVVDGKAYEYRGVSKKGVVFSADSAHFGWVAARESGQVAVIDGQESPPYSGIDPQGIVFSPDGKRSAYSASSGGKFLVVLDGEEGPLFDSVAGFRFSANGQHAVYVGIREGKWYGIVDGVPHGPYDELRSTGGQKGGSQESKMVDAFEISADGSRVGFVATRGEEFFVVVDNKELGPYAGCGGLALSPEGSRVAYLASRGEGWLMMVDGVEHPGRAMESLSFSPDGKRMASAQKRGEKRVAVIEDAGGKAHEGKEYDRIESPGIRFSADGSHTAYMAELDGEKLVVVDGVEGPHFKRAGKTPLGFVPNSGRVMYSVVRSQKREALVIGGVEGPAVTSYRGLTFSPDGSRYVYLAEKEENRWVVVLDGEEYGPGGKLQPGETRAYSKVAKGPPTFSGDGKRVAWVALSDKGLVVVVDGKESQPYNVVMRSAVDFTPDGKHFAFVGARDGKNMIVVDDFEIDNGWDPPLQHSHFVWEDERTFSIRGSRNPRYLLIEVEILEPGK